MDNLQLQPHKIPLRLYRVNYAGTMSAYTPGEGIKAATIGIAPPLRSDQSMFLQSLKSHLVSPYVSLFENKRHAENWALSWKKNNERECHVIEIDGTQLSEIKFFHPYEIELQLDVSAGVIFPIVDRDEFVCLGLIPNHAIIGSRSTSAIDYGNCFPLSLNRYMLIL